MLVLWVCVVIGAGVYGAMIVAIVTFRKSTRRRRRQVHAQHDGRSRLDRDPGRDPRRAWPCPAAETLITHEGHARLGAHDQGHGLPVALALRLHRRRRAVLQHARPREQRGAPAATRESIRTPSRTICSTSTTAVVVPVDTQGAAAHHGRRRRCTRGGCRRSPSSRTPCRASSTTPGSRPTRRARIAASAPSSAAWITASCRSSSRSRAKERLRRLARRSEQQRDSQLHMTHTDATERTRRRQGSTGMSSTAIDTTATARAPHRHGFVAWLHALDHDDESQGHRHAVPAVQPR